MCTEVALWQLFNRSWWLICVSAHLSASGFLLEQDMQTRQWKEKPGSAGSAGGWTRVHGCSTGFQGSAFSHPAACNPGEWVKVLQECGSCREPSYKSRKYILSRRIKAFQRWSRSCFHNIFHFSLHKTWHSLVYYKAPFFPLTQNILN